MAIPSKTVHTLIWSAALLLLGGSRNLFSDDRSANAGLMGPAPFHGTAAAFVIDPKNRSVIYAATSRGLFKSTDGGANWSPTKLTAGVNALVLDPANPSIMYAATSGKGV